MTASPRVVPFPRRLECTQCGAEATAACGCLDPIYKLAPGERAARAVAANPAMSDRAIAEEIGVGNATVSRARRRSTVSDDTVGARTGRDGRTRQQPARRPAADVAETSEMALWGQVSTMLKEMSPRARRWVLIRASQMVLRDRLDATGEVADVERMIALELNITVESGRSFQFELRRPTDRE